MAEHITDMHIIKIQKYEKLDMSEHKTDLSITKIEKYNKTELDGAHNRYEHY